MNDDFETPSTDQSLWLALLLALVGVPFAYAILGSIFALITIAVSVLR